MGLLSAVATQIDRDKVPKNDYFSPYYGYNWICFGWLEAYLCYYMAEKN